MLSFQRSSVFSQSLSRSGLYLLRTNQDMIRILHSRRSIIKSCGHRHGCERDIRSIPHFISDSFTRRPNLAKVADFQGTEPTKEQGLAPRCLWLCGRTH
jgi:hypothetical protein